MAACATDQLSEPKAADSAFDDSAFEIINQTIPNPFYDLPEWKDVFVPAENPGFLDWSVQYLLEQRENVSSAVTQLGRNMDAYFAGPGYQANENESYLSVRMSQKWLESGKLEPELDYKFRLDLPGTKKRYRLIISYDDDETQTLEQKNRPSQAAQVQENQSFFAGLVKTLADEPGHWQTKVGAGIKVKLPPDPFFYYRIKREKELSEFWKLELGGRAEWFYSDGYGADFDILFNRLVNQDKLLRFRTAFDWREETDTLGVGEIVSFFHPWSDTEAVEYQIGTFGSGLHHFNINTYYISASYRKKAYKDWFYINVIPELAFERENDFSGVASITAGIEIYFR